MEEDPLPEQIDQLFERTDARAFSILSEIVEIVRESSICTDSEMQEPSQTYAPQ
jgi:hypothetical protein